MNTHVDYHTSIYDPCTDDWSSCLVSDLSFTNSLATSSLYLCESILKIVHPVSFICIRLPSPSHSPVRTLTRKIMVIILLIYINGSFGKTFFLLFFYIMFAFVITIMGTCRICKTATPTSRSSLAKQ